MTENEERKMARFWLSWYQPTKDYRPLLDPPNEHVLGWWCSGYRGSDDVPILCALIAARSEDEAQASVKTDWPEAEEWRFCEKKPDDYIPGDRFPIDGWSKERIEKAALQIEKGAG